MRFLTKLALALILTATLATGQQAFLTTQFTGPNTSSTISLLNAGVSFHKATWSIVGAPASCTFTVDSSADAVSWSVGGILGATTCTSNGASSVISANVNYVRVNLSALTASNTLYVSYAGYTNNPISISLPVSPANGGLGLVSPTAHSIPITEGASNANLLTSPAANGVYNVLFNVSGGVAVDPTAVFPGVGVGTPTSPYALLYSDRATYQRLAGGTTFTINLCQITGNCASNFPLVIQNGNSGLLTINANAADNIDGSGAGGSSTLISNFAAFLYQDSSSAPGNWWSIKVPTFAAFGTTCANALTWSTTTGFGCSGALGGAVSSVFSRTGAVVATSGDYTLDLISALAASKSWANGSFALTISGSALPVLNAQTTSASGRALRASTTAATPTASVMDVVGSSNEVLFQVDKNGHAGTLNMAGTAPTITAGCGTSPSVTANSSDNGGQINVGTGGTATTCTVTFHKAWTNAPFCTASASAVATGVPTTVTSTTATVVFATTTAWPASALINWTCENGGG